MSVIAARVNEFSIDIAADSVILKDNLKRLNFKKLRKIEGIIVGGCGNAEELSLFFQFVEDNEPLGTTVKNVTDYMLEFSKMKEQYTQDAKIECAYLLVIDGHLFETEGVFVQEVFDYTAIGEGEQYALAALHLGHSAHEAVKVSCDLCYYTSEPIVELHSSRSIL